MHTRTGFARGWRPMAATGLVFLLIGTALLVQRRTAVDNYWTFIVGWPAFAGATKARDIYLAFSAILLGVGATLVLAPFLRRLAHEPWLRERPTVEVGLLAALPLFFAVGLASTSTSAPGQATTFALIGAAVLAIAVVSLRVAQSTGGEGDLRDVAAIIGGTALLAAFVPFVAAVVILATLSVSFAASTILAASTLVAVATFAYATFSLRSANPKRARWLATVVQLLLAPGYLAIVPVFQEGAVAAESVGRPLFILVAALVAVSMLDALRRSRRGASPFSPIACGAILTLAAPALPLFAVSNDDYHLGEYVNGWWALRAGLLPYVDYDMAHGLINAVPGAFSELFFDGTASSILAGVALSFFLQQLLLYRVLAALVSIPIALALTILGMPLLQGPLPAMGIALGILCQPRLLRRLPTWLACWVLIGTTLVLFIPGQGAALVLATLPFGLWMSWRAVRTQPRTTVGMAAAVGSLFAMLALATPFVPVLVEALRYVLENGGINHLAYGVNWALSFDDIQRDHTFPEQMLRVLWMLSPAIGIAVLAIRGHASDLKRRADILLLSSVAVLLPLTLLSYVFGRIDPGALSRPGTFSAWVLVVLLPLLFASVQRKTLAVASSVVLLLLVFSFARFPRVIEIVEGRLRVSVVPDEALAMPAQHGLAHVGAALLDPVHADGVKRLRSALDSRLAPGEAFLDLTGRSAQYVYVDRTIPRHAGAPFNLAHPAQQARLVETLEKERPKIILLHSQYMPSLNFDGLNTSLRTPILYRWIIENYVPFAADGFIFARPRTVEHAAAADVSVIVPIRAITDPNWENGISRSGDALVVESVAATRGLGVGAIVHVGGLERQVVAVEADRVYLNGPPLRPEDGHPNSFTFLQPARYRELALWETVFGVADLLWIPHAWGGSFDALNAGAMTHVLDLAAEPSPTDVSVRLQLPANIDTRAAGLLVFDVLCEPMNAPANLRVSFGTDDEPGANGTLRFYGANGRVVVPLDTQPAWMLSPVSFIDIELEDVSRCGSASFRDYALYGRVVPN